MKIGYYCESPADRAALEIFTEGILGAPPEPINMDLEARSVPGFFNALDGVYRGVHYNSDAEGLVIVVDSDDSGIHELAHDDPKKGPGTCRYCRICEIIEKARRQLKPRQDRPKLKVAIGLAVPAIEAWYLVGTKDALKEADWRPGAAKKGRLPRSRLKELVYATDLPSLELETKRAAEESRRLIADLAKIEAAFPIGFGLMAKEIRSWRVSDGSAG